MLVALTGALIPLTSSETAISAHHRRAAQMLYAAEAAFECGNGNQKRTPTAT